MTEDRLLVSALRESPNRPGRYLVVLSDGRELLATAALLGELGVASRGKELSAEAAQKLEHESRITVLADRALDSLARARRTRRELEIRLRKRETDSQLIRAALDRLEASGVLSDEETARSEAQARLRAGDGYARIKQRLRQKGVSESATSSALAAVMADAADQGYDELAACQQIAERRSKGLRSLPREVAARRLLAFLLRRGYSGSIARQAVNNVLGDA